MPSTSDLFHLAARYHRALPDRIRAYLNARGIPDEILGRRFLGWNGSRITIPVFNRRGVCASFRLAKDPEDKSDSPKMLSSRGSKAELYGWEVLRLRPKRVIICEGEFDRLVLEANGSDAVTSTGGAGTFRKEWAEAFAEIPEVYVCFDRDDAGRKGALRVAGMIAHAKLVELPEEVGDGGDVTDFFIRLGKSGDDFLALLAEAHPAPPLAHRDTRPTPMPAREDAASQLRAEAERIKREVRIEDVVDYYLQLRRVGKTYVGLCPFHEDHDPSFTVYPEDGTFHCYGCGAHGDALTFLQKVEGWSFRQALYMLDQFGGDHEPRID
jgi:DNA primase